MAYSLSNILSLLLILVYGFFIAGATDSGGLEIPIAPGLSWNFYHSSCPQLESIVRTHLWKAFRNDVGLAAGLLRLQLHDCFIQGCDGSVLLDGPAGGPSEKTAIPNLTLRKGAFKIIEDLRRLIHRECGRVVSCSDIVTLSARDSVFLTGGPDFPVPLGRRDGLTFATEAETLANLVPPSANTTAVLKGFAAKNLDTIDSVALSGGHTIGISHCSSFTARLYPKQDPTMEKNFANRLKAICPALHTNSTADLDIRSPNKFDNKYFLDLIARQGVFTSDQDLFTDSRTKGLVLAFAADQQLFFEKFAIAMVKMGQVNILTGAQGEIRANCSATNSDNSALTKEEVEVGLSDI